MTKIQIEHDCAALCHAFGYHLDQRDYEAAASLFTDDGLWIRYGAELRGREALLAAMNQRSLRQLTRHLVTNIHFTEVGSDTARAVVTILAFFNPDAVETPALLPQDSLAVMDFHDIYTRTPAGWRILERDTLPILLPPSLLEAIAGRR